MIDNEPPKVGDYRITEDTAHEMGPGWEWRFSVEQLRPASKFLWWSWPEKWVVVFSEGMLSSCQNYISTAAAGPLGTKVVSYHKGSQ